MDNQKRTGYMAPFKAGNIEGDIELLYQVENKVNWMAKCLVCGEELEMCPTEISRHRYGNIHGCKKCRKRKPCPTHSHHPGDIIGCYKLIRTIQVDQPRKYWWEVECIHCGKVQRINISNAMRRKSQKCNYCDNPDYVPPAYHTGSRPITKTLDERSFINYRHKMVSNSQDDLKKNKPWELTLEQYSQLIHGDCYYCGEPPTADNQWNKGNKRAGENVTFLANGIDRIDPDKGYTIDNCVPCCKQCNRMKWDYTPEQFYSQLRKILNHINKRSTTIENTPNEGGSE